MRECGDLVDLYFNVDFGQGGDFCGQLRYVEGFGCLRLLDGKSGFG